MLQSTEDLKEGFELPSLSKEVSLDKLKIFSALTGKSLHTDEQVAKEFGFPRAVAQGLMSYIYLTEALVRFFGKDWLKGGILETAFLKLIFDGDTILTKAIVHSKHMEGQALRVNLDVFCENQHGENVTAGTATVLVDR